MELYIHCPSTSSWRGDRLKKGTGTTLPLPYKGKRLVQLTGFISNYLVISVFTSTML